MSDITRDTVRHLASLSRIALTDSEVESLTTELDAIVEAISTVREAVGPDVSATSHPVPLSNVFRPDVPGSTLSPAEAFAGAPSHDGERFRVSAILGEEQ